MAETPEDPPRSGGVPPRSGQGAEGDRVFELWLNARLHQLYDEVMREPIPPQLLQLIETDRNRHNS